MRKLLFFLYGTMPRAFMTCITAMGLYMALLIGTEAPFNWVLLAIVYIPLVLAFTLGPKYTQYNGDFRYLDEIFSEMEKNGDAHPEKVAQEWAGILNGTQGGYVWDRFFKDQIYYDKYYDRFIRVLRGVVATANQLSSAALLDLYRAFNTRPRLIKEAGSKNEQMLELVNGYENLFQEACRKRLDDAMAQSPKLMTPMYYLENILGYRWVLDRGEVSKDLLALFEVSYYVSIPYASLLEMLEDWDTLDPEIKTVIKDALRQVGSTKK